MVRPFLARAFPDDTGAYVTWYGAGDDRAVEVAVAAPDGRWVEVPGPPRAVPGRAIEGLTNGVDYEVRVRSGGVEARATVRPAVRGRSSFVDYQPFLPGLSVFCTFAALDDHLRSEGIEPSTLRLRGSPVQAWDRHVPDGVYTVGDRQLLLSRAADRVPAYQPLLPVEVVRAVLADQLWGPPGRPVAGVQPTAGGLEVELAPGLRSRVRRLAPSVARPRAYALFHEGHDATALEEGRYLVEFLLELGFVVFALDMPLQGVNAVDARPGLRGHFDLWRHEPGPPSPVGWLLLPALAVLDVIEQEAGAGATIVMTGRSGGGWTTYMTAALDARVDVACAYSAGSPQSQRLADPLEAWELGDYEQFVPYLYDVVGHENLIANAGTRATFVSYSPQDPCCYRLGPGDPFFDWLAQASKATGRPIVVSVDPDQTEHGPSERQLGELATLLSQVTAEGPPPR